MLVAVAWASRESMASAPERLIPSSRARMARAIRALLDGMSRSGALAIDSREAQATATSMVVVLTYWLSCEYVRDPRRALEPDTAQLALLRGAHHVLNLLAPYLEQGQRMHLLKLGAAYSQAES